MAYELLTGRLPFNDKRNLYNPALSAVLRSILTDKLDFKKPCWKEISPEGIDFVRCAFRNTHPPPLPKPDKISSANCIHLHVSRGTSHVRSHAYAGVQDAPQQGPREATFSTGGPEPPVATGGCQ